MVGKRVGYGRESMAPHSLTLTMVGASLLWVGWFGFNAGSALEANGFAALAFINTLVATAGAVLAWCVGEALMRGKASMLGAASGAVAGLVAITPAAGNVGIGGALVIGLVGGFACLWGVNGLKKLLGADDSLDVFGVHCIGGIVGALGTAIVADPKLGGQGYFDYTKFPAVAVIAKLKGDATKGANTAQACFLCHNLNGKGQDYGPALGGFAKAQTTEVVINAIVNPSAEISHGFDGTQVNLRDGSMIHGLVLSAGDPTIIQSTGGLTQMVPAAKIRNRQPLGR
eukprot:gene25492-46535_t